MCALADFDGKSLRTSGPKFTLKLRLNRTEVLKRKANCVMPISPLKARYNKANYSLDGADGSAIDLSGSQDFAEVIDDAAEDAVSEDVVFDPLIYDYIPPASKEVDALTISAAPGRGGGNQGRADSPCQVPLGSNARVPYVYEGHIPERIVSWKYRSCGVKSIG